MTAASRYLYSSLPEQLDINGYMKYRSKCTQCKEQNRHSVSDEFDHDQSLIG